MKLDRKFAVGVAGGAAAVVALATLATNLIAKTESTTELNRYDTMMVDGHKALAPKIVAGRTQGLYHPLPWVGVRVHVSCPGPLKAVRGVVLRCSGRKGDGTVVEIPVTVVRATSTHVTWRFER